MCVLVYIEFEMSEIASNIFNFPISSDDDAIHSIRMNEHIFLAPNNSRFAWAAVPSGMGVRVPLC